MTRISNLIKKIATPVIVAGGLTLASLISPATTNEAEARNLLTNNITYEETVPTPEPEKERTYFHPNLNIEKYDKWNFHFRYSPGPEYKGTYLGTTSINEKTSIPTPTPPPTPTPDPKDYEIILNEMHDPLRIRDDESNDPEPLELHKFREISISPNQPTFYFLPRNCYIGNYEFLSIRRHHQQRINKKEMSLEGNTDHPNSFGGLMNAFTFEKISSREADSKITRRTIQSIRELISNVEEDCQTDYQWMYTPNPNRFREIVGPDKNYPLFVYMPHHPKNQKPKIIQITPQTNNIFEMEKIEWDFLMRYRGFFYRSKFDSDPKVATFDGSYIDYEKMICNRFIEDSKNGSLGFYNCHWYSNPNLKPGEIIPYPPPTRLLKEVKSKEKMPCKHIEKHREKYFEAIDSSNLVEDMESNIMEFYEGILLAN